MKSKLNIWACRLIRWGMILGCFYRMLPKAILAQIEWVEKGMMIYIILNQLDLKIAGGRMKLRLQKVLSLQKWPYTM